MARFIFVIAFWLLSLVASTAQPAYLNTRQTLGYLATVFTAVYPTDSCLYVKGEMTDSLLRSGSFFGKVDLEGNFTRITEFIETGKDYNFWDVNILLNPAGNFVLAGSVFDPEMAAFAVEINPDGQIIRYQQFRSPFFPTEKYIVPRSMCLLKDGGYGISGTLAGTPQQKINIFLYKLDKTFMQEWYRLERG